MKFEINNHIWTIKQKKQDEMKKEVNDNEEDNYYFGLTLRKKHEIWLDNSLCLEQKKQTLKHELMHCYISSFLTLEEIKFTEELLCDISANANDFIYKLTDRYFEYVNSN